MRFHLALDVDVDEPCPDADCAEVLALMRSGAKIGGGKAEIHVGDLIDLLEVPGSVTLRAFEVLP